FIGTRGSYETDEPFAVCPKIVVVGVVVVIGVEFIFSSVNVTFVVFYGSTADFAWVSDAAIISYKGVEAFTKYAQETVDKVCN
ncbi:unnamed protein product, partial [Rotaria sp. Silwood2]